MYIFRLLLRILFISILLEHDSVCSGSGFGTPIVPAYVCVSASFFLSIVFFLPFLSPLCLCCFFFFLMFLCRLQVSQRQRIFVDSDGRGRNKTKKPTTTTTNDQNNLIFLFVVLRFWSSTASIIRAGKHIKTFAIALHTKRIYNLVAL